jgi:hypothetical protein
MPRQRTGAVLSGMARVRRGAVIAALALVVGTAAAIGGGISPVEAQAGSRDTPVVVRAGVWYLRGSNSSGPADTTFPYGNPLDIPLQGRWRQGAGDTPAVVRGAHWFLRHSNTGGVADVDFPYGNAGDWPVAGDWNGDGIDTPGVVRNGVWYLRNSNSAGVADVSFVFGNAGDRPLAGDWDGDGIDTPAVYRGATWYLRNSNSGGVADVAFPYGDVGDRPVVGDWTGDGADLPGVVRSGVWYLRNANSAGVAHSSFVYGNPGDLLLGERPIGLLRPGDAGPDVVRLQERLEQLGFWVGRRDGRYESLTEQAVFAFDKYHGLPRDGRVDEATRAALAGSGRVQARTTAGDAVEIDKARQVLFVVRGGATVWAFNTSTGTEGYYTYGGRRYVAHTPTGHFSILRQIDGWRTSHLGRLYRPKYFTDYGIAVHGSTSVPPHPASHGCVRLTIAAMDFVWNTGLVPIGMPVWVY